LKQTGGTMIYNGRDLMDYFPLESPRSGQVAVLNEIDRVFSEGKKFIILEGPVGCGKSAIAMTLAKAFGNAHLITPRKSLQNQYFDDFTDDVVLMKGRGSYPCTKYSSPSRYKAVIRHVESGSIPSPGVDETNCGNAPCRTNSNIVARCAADVGVCPYIRAMEIAQDNNIVVHNLHSFIYQTNFSAKFEKRSLMVIDEAHEIEGIMRDFVTKKITTARRIREADLPVGLNTLDGWCDFLLDTKCVPTVSNSQARAKEVNPEYRTNLDVYIDQVQSLRAYSEFLEDKFTVKHNVLGGSTTPTFEFIPHKLGNSVYNNLFSFGDRIVLMSGTIYDKVLFCRNLGINPNDAYLIRIPSTFPIGNRPIYLKEKYQADTSYVGWNENFRDIIEKVESIMGIFSDVKGLIHAPSYEAAEQLLNALPEDRVMSHDKTNFQERLSEFYGSEGNMVFISPVCQQGVDFREDRARFQIVLRVPYANTSDEFIRSKVENDFNWYNYQALIVFGQQIGRINRSENDFGATFLMDTRFNRFISRNSGRLPKWLQNAIIWR